MPMPLRWKFSGESRTKKILRNSKRNIRQADRESHTLTHALQFKWNIVSYRLILSAISFYLYCCSASMNFALSCWSLVILLNWWLLWNFAAIRCEETMVICTMETSPERKTSESRNKNERIYYSRSFEHSYSQKVFMGIEHMRLSLAILYAYLGGILYTSTWLRLMQWTLRLLLYTERWY